MALTDQDRKDLLGLESRLGDPDSNNRARALLSSNPDAVGFVRGVRTLHNELEAAILPMYPPVPVGEAQEITRKVLADFASRTEALPPRRLRLRLPWAALGVAAAVAMLLVPASWLIVEQVNRPTLVSVPPGGSLGSDPLFGLSRERISLPYEVKATTPPHVAFFRNGMVVAAEQAGFRIESPDVVSFSQDVLYVQTPDSAMVRFPQGQVELNAAGAEVTIFEDYIKVLASTGVCNVRLAGNTHRLQAGESITWGLKDGALHFEKAEAQVPAWVDRLLTQARK